MTVEEFKTNVEGMIHGALIRTWDKCAAEFQDLPSRYLRALTEAVPIALQDFVDGVREGMPQSLEKREDSR